MAIARHDTLRCWRGLIGGILVAWLTVDAHGEGIGTAQVDATRLHPSEEIVVDGDFAEAAWERARVIRAFVQRDPSEGALPSHPTEVRIVYSADALYVAVRAFDDAPERIIGLLTRRDERSPSDWIRVVVDADLDGRTAYEFAVNPAGVKVDRYFFNDSSVDASWNAVWDVGVAQDGSGWRAEFRIPFSQLRGATEGSGPMGLAVFREVGRLAETSSWPLVARSETGFVSQFGRLDGVERLRPPQRLEVVPYSVARVRVAPPDDNPLTSTVTPASAIGVDLSYALTPGLTLTATMNPDFGQIEADPAVVNLDAFETFFAERRPFFVEGAGLFQFDIDCNDGACTGLFYSRRVGRAPQGRASLGDGEHASAPDAATILGAAKLTGRVGPYAVGALTAVTSTERATIEGPTGRRTERVEPRSAYSVLRARREFANRSNLGVMVTSVHRGVNEAVAFLPSRAQTGGVDVDVRLGRRFAITGFLAASHVVGRPEAIRRLQENPVHAFQRPDAPHVELDETARSLSGHAGSIAFAKISGERTRYHAVVDYKSPGFDINDLGYLRRADERSMSQWFQIRWPVPGRFVRSFVLNLNQWAGWNFAGDRLWGGGNVNMHWTWVNQATTGFGVNLNAAPMRDRVTRGGPAVLGNPSLSLWYYAGTNPSRPWSLRWEGNHEIDRHDTRRDSLAPSATWRPTTALSISGGFRHRRNDDDAQWVANEDETDGSTRAVFGRLIQRTTSMTLRVNYTLSPTLSLQVYAEPFVSVGTFDGFKVLAAPRAPRYEDRYRPVDVDLGRDFAYRSLRATSVLRWEYRPGGALFVVWQQGREVNEPGVRSGSSSDLASVFSAPATNVVLVKLSYWFNR